MKATWVSNKGMLGKLVSKKQANIRKGNGKKKKNKRTPPKNVFQKGVDGQKSLEEKRNFEKEVKRQTKKENRIGRK